MSTPHNSAQRGDYAKTVLMPGDPKRAQYIAETFLDNPRLVNDVRGIKAYTGTYKGVPVSVMASGMGMPSIGIYSYELFTEYGVENIVRVGSAGSYTDRLNVRDVVLGNSAWSESTYALTCDGTTDKVIMPSAELNAVISKTAEDINISCKLARIHSADVFYTSPKVATWQQLRDASGSECVEMESFALFHNANMCGKRAACLLTISDSFVNSVELTADERQNSFTTMMRLALESAITL